MATPSKFLSTHEAYATIAFPEQLSAALSKEHVVYLLPNTTVKDECEGNQRNPVAAPGYLCVYTGSASNHEGEALKTAPIQTVAGAPGASVDGAVLVFVVAAGASTTGENHVTEQGSWAVTAG